MKTLSRRQSQRCEDAKEESCKCRCGGAFHGGRRGSVETLPFGDPHSLKKVCPRCEGTGKEPKLSFEMKCWKCKGLKIIEPKKGI